MEVLLERREGGGGGDTMDTGVVVGKVEQQEWDSKGNIWQQQQQQVQQQQQHPDLLDLDGFGPGGGSYPWDNTQALDPIADFLDGLFSPPSPAASASAASAASSVVVVQQDPAAAASGAESGSGFPWVEAQQGSFFDPVAEYQEGIFTSRGSGGGSNSAPSPAESRSTLSPAEAAASPRPLLPHVATPTSDQQLLLCHVCKEKADKFKCYGGRVCLGCRSFFRRAVRSKYYELFKCQKNERCQLDSANVRRKCQECRFKKCLEAGMMMDSVLSEEERDRRFNKFKKMARQAKGAAAAVADDDDGESESKRRRRRIRRRNDASTSSSSSSSNGGDKWSSSSPLNAAEMDLTAESLVLKEDSELVRDVREICLSSKYDYLSSDPEFLREYSLLGYFGGRLTRQGWRKFREMQGAFLVRLFGQMPRLREGLTKRDVQGLCRANGKLVNSLRCASFLVEPDSCWSALFDGEIRKKERGRLWVPASEAARAAGCSSSSSASPGSCDSFSVLSMLLCCGLGDRRPQWEYQQFFPPRWAGSIDQEVRHLCLIRQMNAWPRDSMSARVDPVQAYLMYLVLALDATGGVQDRDAVDRLRGGVADMLGRYLRDRYGEEDGRRRLRAGLVGVAGYAREACYIAEEAGEGRM